MNIKELKEAIKDYPDELPVGIYCSCDPNGVFHIVDVQRINKLPGTDRVVDVAVLQESSTYVNV